jgi:hypothetical protein
MATDRRRATDFLSISHTTPAAERALDLIAREPGLTVADLRDRLGVSMGRTWQILNILQQPRVQRRRVPPPHRPRRRVSPK